MPPENVSEGDDRGLAKRCALQARHGQISSSANSCLERLIAGSEGVVVVFAGADTHSLLEFESEDLAVADLARLGGPADGADDRIHLIASHRDLDLSFGTSSQCSRRRDESRYAPLATVTFAFSYGETMTPMRISASRASSSLKGLAIATTIS
jgi:hypothetical protein